MKSRVKVFLEESAFLGMVLAAIEVFDSETYGILIGTRRKEKIWVRQAVCYQASRRKKREVTICHKRDAMVVRSIYGVSSYHYVGDFHSHPYGTDYLSEYDKKSMQEYGDNLSILVAVEPAKERQQWEYKKGVLKGSVGDEFVVTLKAFVYDHTERGVRQVPIHCLYVERLRKRQR